MMKCCDNKGYRNISKIMDKVEILFDSVEVIQRDNVYLYIIENLSESMKDYIRNNFREICKGNNSNKYISVLKEFKERIENKTDKQKMGLVGELLAHIFIRNNTNKFKIVSILFNLEEGSAKKGFDIIITSLNKNILFFSEVKSGIKNEKETLQSKNMSLLGISKNELSKKIKNNKNKALWANAINHAEKIVEKDDEILKILKDIYDEDIEIDNYRNALLVSVVYHDINDILSINEILNERIKILQERFFREVIIFSIQKNTYQKVLDFLEEELKNETANQRR